MVGFKDPPKHSQFKPGQSGNPAGMPKGYKTFKARIQEFAEKEIDLTDLNDKKIKGSVGDGIIMALCAKALKGDTVAAKTIMEHAEAKKLEHSGSIENKHTVSNEDKILLQRMGIKVDD
jgi:hypothetical protein